MLYELFPWMRRRPSVLALLIAGLLYLLGHYLKANGGTISVLDTFTTYLKTSLTAFEPWHIADIFYYELTGCRLSDMAVVCDPPPDMIDVLGGNGGSNSLFATFLLAVVSSIAQIWVQSTWLGPCSILWRSSLPR